MGKIPDWQFSFMAGESPMWTIFVKKGDGSTASVVEKRDVFLVSHACIDKLNKIVKL